MNPDERLQEVVNHARIPAIAFASAELPKGLSQEGQIKPETESVACGKKDAIQSAKSDVTNDTRFPASSLSKIAFTYVVLTLVKDGVLSLDEPLHQIFPNERFKINGEYPDKAKALTASAHFISFKWPA